jgi:diacylglycerol kinase
MIATVILLAAAWAGVSPGELALLAAVIGLVLGAELLNTAVEMLTDLFHPHEGPQAALVKDVSAAAVLSVSIIAAIVGGFVLLPHLGALSPNVSRALAVILALVFFAALCAGFVRTGRPRV